MWHAKITVSLNILYYGHQPERPLALYIEDAGNAPIDSKFIPPFSQKPVAIVNGCMLKCMLAEIKADWKFHKEPRVNIVIEECELRNTATYDQLKILTSKELFNFKCGWSSQEICHHCFAQKSDYLKFPSPLHMQPRRDLESFLGLKRSEASKLDA